METGRVAKKQMTSRRRPSTKRRRYVASTGSPCSTESVSCQARSPLIKEEVVRRSAEFEERWYGHSAAVLAGHSSEDKDQLVFLLSDVLQSLCDGDSSPMNDHSQSRSIWAFYSVAKPQIALPDYVERVLTYVDCSRAVFFMALVYMDQIAVLHSSLRINVFNVHRLFLTAVVLASKYHEDECYTNSHYAQVGGIGLSEMNDLEVAMLSLLEFRLHVEIAEYGVYESLIGIPRREPLR